MENADALVAQARTGVNVGFSVVPLDAGLGLAAGDPISSTYYDDYATPPNPMQQGTKELKFRGFRFDVPESSPITFRIILAPGSMPGVIVVARRLLI